MVEAPTKMSIVQFIFNPFALISIAKNNYATVLINFFLSSKGFRV